MKIYLLSLLLTSAVLNLHGWSANEASYSVTICNKSELNLEFKVFSKKDNHRIVREWIRPHETVAFDVRVELPAYCAIQRAGESDSFISIFDKHDLGAFGAFGSWNNLWPCTIKSSHDYFAGRGSLRLDIGDDIGGAHNQKTSRIVHPIELSRFDVDISNNSDWVLEFEVYSKSDKSRFLVQTIKPKTVVEFAMDIELPAYYTLKKRNQFFTPSEHELGSNDKWSTFFDFSPYTFKWDQDYSARRQSGILRLSVE